MYSTTMVIPGERLGLLQTNKECGYNLAFFMYHPLEYPPDGDTRRVYELELGILYDSDSLDGGIYDKHGIGIFIIT